MSRKAVSAFVGSILIGAAFVSPAMAGDEAESKYAAQSAYAGSVDGSSSAYKIVGTGGKGSKIVGTGGKGSKIVGTGGKGSKIVGTGGKGGKIVGTGGKGAKIVGTGGKGG